MKEFQPFQPRKGAALDAQLFEVPANVRLYTFQPCPGGGKVVHVHAEGQELCADNAVVAFGDLVFQHYYSEFARAEKGAELWRKGDLDGYGQLVFESGKSSIYSYECGCDELKKLYEIMADTDGIYGGRFSGAGFKGCCMALIDPGKAEEIEANA